MVRYADDFVILCESPEQAEAALAVVRDWTAQAGLTLQRADRLLQHRSASRLDPVKTRLVDARTDGFEFLGYRFQAGQRWPREKSLAKFKDTVRAKTSKTVGHGLERVIADLNPTLRGWFEYFKHSHRWTFGTLDGWTAGRLDTPTAAKHPAQAGEAAGDRATQRCGSDTLAKCLFRRTWVVLPAEGL